MSLLLRGIVLLCFSIAPAGACLSQTSSQTSATQDTKNFDLTFDNLKFEMEKGGKFEREMLTDEINSYHSGTVKIRGYIRPSFKQSGLEQFIFVRDNKECCFGPGAAIFDCVLVKLEKGVTTDYTTRPITIEGKFIIKEYYGGAGKDRKVWAIYRMSNARVK